MARTRNFSREISSTWDNYSCLVNKIKNEMKKKIVFRSGVPTKRLHDVGKTERTRLWLTCLDLNEAALRFFAVETRVYASHSFRV